MPLEVQFNGFSVEWQLLQELFVSLFCSARYSSVCPHPANSHANCLCSMISLPPAQQIWLKCISFARTHTHFNRPQATPSNMHCSNRSTNRIFSHPHHSTHPPTYTHTNTHVICNLEMMSQCQCGVYFTAQSKHIGKKGRVSAPAIRLLLQVRAFFSCHIHSSAYWTGDPRQV